MTGDDWIRVEDKLPDENTNVMATNANGETLDEREPVIAYCECGKWFSICWWNFFQYRVLEDVTHWQPLPEPPKEEV